MLARFSISKKKTIKNKKNEENEEPKKKEISDKNILNPLLNLGFEFENIIIANELYNFKDLDEALYFLTRDPETKLFNHKFLNHENNTRKKIKIFSILIQFFR